MVVLVGMIEGFVCVYDCLIIFHEIEKKSSYQNTWICYLVRFVCMTISEFSPILK